MVKVKKDLTNKLFGKWKVLSQEERYHKEFSYNNSIKGNKIL